jgi:hypothetical protein
MTSKKPAKKTTKKAAPKKKASAKKPAAKKKDAPKSKPTFAKADDLVAAVAPVAAPEAPKTGTVIYAGDVKNPSLKERFFAWFRN